MLKQKLTSFLSAVIFIALVVISFFIFSYVIIFAALIALVLFAVAYIKTKFFSNSIHNRPQNEHQQQHTGRTIDHENN